MRRVTCGCSFRGEDLSRGETQQKNGEMKNEKNGKKWGENNVDLHRSEILYEEYLKRRCGA